MSNFRVIAFAGAAGSGKDTAAEHLVKHYNYARCTFAGPLKAALNAMFGWDKALWDNRDWKEAVQPDIGKSPRQMAQTLGTEWGRELVNRDLWMMLAARAVSRAHINGFDGIVFTDCRFNNEAEFVLAQGGVVLQLVRPGVGAVASHVSEQALPSRLVTATIVNDGSLCNLWGQVGEFAEAN
jgi:hypothetical protein